MYHCDPPRVISSSIGRTDSFARCGKPRATFNSVLKFLHFLSLRGHTDGVLTFPPSSYESSTKERLDKRPLGKHVVVASRALPEPGRVVLLRRLAPSAHRPHPGYLPHLLQLLSLVSQPIMQFFPIYPGCDTNRVSKRPVIPPTRM